MIKILFVHSRFIFHLENVGSGKCLNESIKIFLFLYEKGGRLSWKFIT